MPLLDVFAQDAFKTVSMLEPIERIETVPNHIGRMGVFSERGIRDEKVAIEDREGTLSLIQTSPRGAPPTSNEQTEKRKIRDFRTVRIAKVDRIQASELAFLRQFGEEQMLIEAMAEVMRRLSGPNGLLADVETTWENMRLGAVQGIVNDADASAIYNYFTEFSISQPDVLHFDLANKVDGNLRAFIQANVVRAMRRAAKGVQIGRVVALCGDSFWDALIKNAEVRASYLQQQEASQLRDGYDMETFNFAGVTWQNYVGSDDNSKVAVSANDVKFFPDGNTGIFEAVFAPGEAFSDLGQLGVPVYTKIIPDRDRDMYVDIEVYSYPLHIARRPDLLLRGDLAAS